MKISIAPLLLAAALLTSCHPAQHPGPLAADPATYPFTLLPPGELKQDFMVRQSIEVSIVAGGQRHQGKLDAVLQKQGDGFLVVGLGPMNTRAFLIEYRGGHIRYERTNPQVPELPISPRALVVDVERVYFAHAPIPADDFTGHITSTLNGEQIAEDWNKGMLERRSFARTGTFETPITIEFGAGYTTKNRDPHRIVLRNPWLGYEVTITSDGAEVLE